MNGSETVEVGVVGVLAAVHATFVRGCGLVVGGAHRQRLRS
jgi:hypothetical protein